MNGIRAIFTRGLASEARVFNSATPPKHTLASLRTFPSLEPHTFIPLPASYLTAPLRRDFLWQSVVYEADNARSLSGNVPTKGDKPFSNRKLLPQKGTGKARTGDANSPIRDNGLKPFGRKAGEDTWKTELPRKIYQRGFQQAIAEKYKAGKLIIVGGEKSGSNGFDDVLLDFRYQNPIQMEEFVATHQLEKLSLLFITDVQRDNLIHATEGVKADVLMKEAVEVRDILKANRVYIELSALKWFVGKYNDLLSQE